MVSKKLRKLKNKVRKKAAKKRVTKKAKQSRRRRNIARGEPETAREEAAVATREAKGLAKATSELAKSSTTGRVVSKGFGAAKGASRATKSGVNTAQNAAQKLDQAAGDAGISGPGSVDFAVDGDDDFRFDSVEGAERAMDIDRPPVDVVDGPGGSGGFDLDLDDID